jgi:hypothetical protein
LVFAVVVDLGLRLLPDVLGVSVLVDDRMLVGTVLWSKLRFGSRPRLTADLETFGIAYRLYHRVESIFAVGRVIDFSYASIRLDDCETAEKCQNRSPVSAVNVVALTRVMSFNDAIVSRLPLTLDVAAVAVLDSVRERVRRMALIETISRSLSLGWAGAERIYCDKAFVRAHALRL